jgi:1,4-alpha-glucan branching enzyme
MRNTTMLSAGFRNHAIALMLAIPLLAVAEQDHSKQTDRTAPQWVRDGVVYEIFTRNFSASGDFNGITARLDDLKNLGVNILWLMPIHPNGEKLKKGTFGSPMP